jgi:aminopeptidase YwaD
MITHQIKERLAGELNGENALLHMDTISHFWRSPGSSEYDAASRYILNYWQRVGVGTTVIEAPLDNKTMLGNTPAPYAWEPRDALLKVVSPEERILVDFKRTPTCINSWSAATPPEGVTAELVYVGNGDQEDDYKGRDVAGKVVLVDRGYTWRTQSLAMEKYGALGFITDDIQEIPFAKTREMFPDFVLWNTLFERNGIDGGPVIGWGLCISPRNGDLLRRLLQQGAVQVHVRLDAETFEGRMENPLGVIEGAVYPEEEVLLTAHLDHTRPGGLDNAAGCAGHVEVLRAIAALIERGDIPQPKRSIKALFGPEGHQINAYFYPRPETLDDILVAFGPCGAGNPAVLKGTGILGTASVALPTFANDLCQDILEEVNTYFRAPGPRAEYPFDFHVSRSSHSGDSLAINAWNVPCIDMNMSGNIYWHSQFDTVDKASAETFAKFGWAYAVAALTIANAGPEETIALINRVLARSQERLARVAASAQAGLRECSAEEAGERLAQGLDRLHYAVERDGRVINSALVLVQKEDSATRDAVSGVAARLVEQLENAGRREAAELQACANRVHDSVQPAPAKTIPAAAEARPRLKRRGWMDIKLISRELAPKYEQWQPGVLNKLGLIQTVYEAASLCDGKRTIADISRILNHEYHQPPLDVRVVVEIFQDLKRLDFVDV